MGGSRLEYCSSSRLRAGRPWWHWSAEQYRPPAAATAPARRPGRRRIGFVIHEAIGFGPHFPREHGCPLFGVTRRWISRDRPHLRAVAVLWVLSSGLALYSASRATAELLCPLWRRALAPRHAVTARVDAAMTASSPTVRRGSVWGCSLLGGLGRYGSDQRLGSQSGVVHQ